MEEAWIVATGRSAIGRANKGSLVDKRADELVAEVSQAVVDKVPQLDVAEIQDVICGNVAQAGETGFNIGRVIPILNQWPESVPGHTVQRFCASSLQGIAAAANSIKVGEGDVYLAAGVEKSSRPPETGSVGGRQRPPRPDPEQNPQNLGGINFKLTGRTPPYPNVYIPMGMTAENVVDKYGVKREDMDRFSKLSQDRAVASQDNGVFDREIIPVTKADGSVVARDDGPRANTTLEKLAELPPAFKEGGQVTAGNSCPLNDGAAAVLLMSKSKAEQLGVTPLARVVATAYSGNNPEIMGVAPIDAIGKVLKKVGMSITDIDIVELNEAFAAQVLPVSEAIGIDIENQLNPHGGAIALGHPFGMTGARIMTTLINGLQTRNQTIGLETMCAAGGMAMATVIERLS